jgi:hypothetical protein
MSKRRLLCCLCLAALVTCIGTIAHAATPEEVDQAIAKGREYLLSKQTPAGHWEVVEAPTDKEQSSVMGGQWGGRTAIATYALIAAGEKPQSAKIQDAIKFLKQAQLRGTYAVGLRSQIWHMIPKTKDLDAAVYRDMELLLNSVLTVPATRGLYGYYVVPELNTSKERMDHSVSQYGVLGAWALEQAGARIPDQYWQVVEDAWQRDQGFDGSWAYGNKPAPDKPGTITMTAAGVATLFITQDYLHANEGVVPHGNITNPAIEKGLQWISKNFGAVGGNTYALYGIERIGVASGFKYFGDIDWFQNVATTLVKDQHPDGSWGPGGYPTGPDPAADVPATSFALLCLSRGRAPVVMNKLQYDVQDAKKAPQVGLWNQRPRDVANVTRWIASNIEHDLNWQVVKLQAPLEELLEAPILYIGGSNPLTLSDADLDKLKAYVEAGGMILGNSDGAKAAFTESFKKIGEKMFGRKFAELPADHVIYTNEQYPRGKWRIVPQVLALGNGAREFMLIAPTADFARQWQLRALARPEAFQLPANIFLYAVDKQNLQYKGQSYYVKPNPAVKAEKSIRVARLQYTGNWDPEPGGWRRLSAIMNNDQTAALTVEPVKLGDGKLAGAYRVAHLTGTEKVKFTDAEKKDLADFVKQGGTLIVDAAGGQGDFAASVETELAAIFGADAAKKLSTDLPADHAVYRTGTPITEWAFRSYVRVKLGSMPKAPRLRAVDVSGRVAVIYSPMDLSVGMVGKEVDGIYGYSPKVATQLMANLLSYADANR